MKKGLTDYIANSRDIQVGAVYNPAVATEQRGEIPAGFGAEGLDWGALGNLDFGDCFFACHAHMAMALASLVDRSPEFTEESVLRSYAAYLGVAHLTRENDRGTDPTKGSKFIKEIGILGGNGREHHVGAFAFDQDSDVDKLLNMLYDFGALNLCFSLPRNAEETFEEAEANGFAESIVWDYEAGSPDEGGHSVSAVNRNKDTGNIRVISWGREVEVTPAFIENKLQVAIASLSHAQMEGGDGETHAAISGLNWSELKAALEAI